MSTIGSRDVTNSASINIDCNVHLEPQTLHEMLAARANAFGERCAFTFQGTSGDVSISFGELNRRSRAIAVRLSKIANAGDRVLLLFPAGLDFISSFFGCLYAGILAVPATYPKPRRPMPRLTAIAQDCQAAAVLTTRDTIETLDRSSIPDLCDDSSWIAVEEIDDDLADQGMAEQTLAADSDSQPLAFLQYTSGSTSAPKGVMVSHGNLLHNLAMIHQGFGLQSLSVEKEFHTGVFWLPAYHDMGLIGGILESLFVGGHSVLMSPAAFLQRPLGWLETISQERATISGAPNFAYELCVSRSTEEQRNKLDLNSWSVAFCGAEPIRAETLEKFAEVFRPSGFRATSFYPCYGLAEGTLLAAGGDGPGDLVIRKVCRTALEKHEVAFRPDSDDPDLFHNMVGSGQAMMGQEIRIVDPESHQLCNEDRVGEVWVKGESIAQGYWSQPEETTKAFAAYIEPEKEGPYLRTGDLGFFTDGHLFVTGRVKDVIIIRGRNHYPQDIEETVGHSHEALRPDAGAVFSVDVEGQEQLVIVHEVDRQYRQANFEEIIRRVRREMSASHELEVHAIALIRHVSLPRTTSGKVQRKFCRQQYLDGQLKVLAQWTREVAKNRQARNEAADGGGPAAARRPPRDAALQRLVASDAPLSPEEIDRLAERVESWLSGWLTDRAALPKEEVHRDKPFADYGLDSLTAVELSEELEDWLGVPVVPTVAWNYPTIATLSVYLAQEAGGCGEASQQSDGAEQSNADDEFNRLLAEIEGLSEEQVRSQLGEGA
jgi:acyl-CoA synthetase (AMP-forming)/AMP-acid ligase II/acyl carrier protein